MSAPWWLPCPCCGRFPSENPERPLPSDCLCPIARSQVAQAAVARRHRQARALAQLTDRGFVDQATADALDGTAPWATRPGWTRAHRFDGPGQSLCGLAHTYLGRLAPAGDRVPRCVRCSGNAGVPAGRRTA